MQTWQASASRIVYRRFQPGESLISDLESFALAEGITRSRHNILHREPQAVEAS